MEVMMTYVQSFFGWLLQMTVIASVVIFLILLIQKMLGGKLGPRWCHALWLVLLIRMVLPWAPSSRFSLLNLVPSWDRQIQRQQLSEATEQHEPSQAAQTYRAIEAIPAQRPEPDVAIEKQTTPKPGMLVNIQKESKPRLASLRRVLPILWLAGAVVIGAYLLMSNFALWRIVKRERPLLNQKTLELFEQCKSRMNVQALVAIVPSDQIKSPALFGFIRPRLLLPLEMLEKASEEEMQYVFLHELAHLKRRDIYLGWLTSLLQVLHWFNPLVWFAFYRMRTDREFACDALVLTRMGQEKSHEYGGAIVGLLRRFSRSRSLPAMAGILENGSQLKRRMAMIAKFKNNSYQWSPLAVILIIILSCVSLPDAKRTKGSETSTSESAHQPNFRKIWIPTKPGNGVLSPDGERLAFVSEGSVWVIPMHGKVSPDIAGEPVLLTEPMGAWDVMSFLAWSSDGKWIAFNVSDEKEDAIYVVRSSGGVPKKVPVEPRLRNSGYNYRLSLSPDSKVLAFSSRYIEKSEAEPPEETGGLPPSVRGFFIYTVPVAGGEVKRLTDSASGEPAFSPDGKKIAFVKYYTSEKGELCGSLWVVPAVGGTPIQVNDSDLQRQVGGPIWSPDGKMIAFTSRASSEERRKEICIVPVSETGKALASPTKIELPLATNDILAGWTPDNKIGVFLHNPDPWAIYTVPASGGKPVQVTTSGWATHPQWSPDGERIYFRWGGGDIASVPSHGGKLSIVRIDPPVGLSYPGSGNAVSPDGKQIVFCGGGNIHTIPIEGGEPKEITQGGFPCWSPDGKSIAFIRSHQMPPKRESGWNIYIIPSKGGDVRQLTSEPDNIRRTHIGWSPDGKSIAYFAKDKTIRIIPVQGGEPRIVATAEELKNHDELVWSPDGTKLVYSLKGSIWVVSPDGGEPEEIEIGLDAKAGHVSWSPDSKKLAFTAIKGGEEELWLMENFLPGAPVAKPASATTLQKIRDDWGRFANLSPDGKYVSDVDWETSNLVVWELATGKVQPLTSKGSWKNEYPEYPFHSVISPDGKRVTYQWYYTETATFNLYIVGLDGSGRRLLRQNEYIVPRDWSPDGKKILAIFFDKDANQMVWVSASDGTIQVVKTFDVKTFDKASPSNVDLSPDGRYIAYTLNGDIFLFAIDENREIPLVQHPANDKLLGWTPDGKYVFFTSDRRGAWDAWLLQVAGGEPQGFPEIVKLDIGNVKPIGFTQSGSYYYRNEQRLSNVFVATLDLETGKVLSPPMPVRQTGATTCHDWSPDGQYLAYCTRSPDKSQIIHLRTLATGQERTLANNLPYFSYLRWSLDGQSILVTRFVGDPHEVIFKIDVQKGERSDLVRSETERLGRCELSPDGKTLFYVRYDTDSKTARLVARDLKSGREKDLFRVVPPTRFGGGLFALSPDGQRLVLSTGLISQPRTTYPTAPALNIVSAAGGEPRELLQFEEEKMFLSGVAWTPDSQDVLFAKMFFGGGKGGKEGELWRISAAGGEPRRLWVWKKQQFGRVRVHPDGRRIAFHSGSTPSELWLMENFLPTAVATSGN